MYYNEAMKSSFSVLRQKTANEKGQVFIEFMLLLVALVSLSFLTLALVNGEIAKLWELMVNMVVGPEAQVRVR